jgi:hypothetical protein
MIKDWIEEYSPATREDAEQALREIMQQIALAGLQRSGFWEKGPSTETQHCGYFMVLKDFLKILISHCSK